MDSTMLMTLLAARNGMPLPTTPDGAIDPSALDSASMMQRLGQDDPQLAAIMQMFAAQKPKPPERDLEVVEAAVVEVDAVAGELAALATRLDAAQSEAGWLRDRCDTLAAALGACAMCWGQDRACRACRGHGLPGYCLPDETLFLEFVLPAVRLMHARRQQPRHAAALAPANHGAPRTDATPNSYQLQG